MNNLKIIKNYNDNYFYRKNFSAMAREVYFIHLIETKKPLKSQPSKYGKNVI